MMPIAAWPLDLALFPLLAFFATILSSPLALKAALLQDFVNCGKGILLSVRNFRRQFRQASLAARSAQRPLEQPRFEQFDQTVLPMLNALSTALPARFKMFLEFCNRLGQFLNSLVLRSDRAHNRRVPAVARHHQRQHGQQLLFKPVRSFAIRFVQNKYVADLHEPGFHVLNVVAKPRHKHYQHAIRQPHDVDFILADADSLDQHVLFSSGVQEQRDFRCRSGQTPEESPRGHRADKRSRITSMPLHSNPIAQNGAPGVRARGINCDHAHLFLLFAVIACQTVNECALPRPWRSGNSREIRLTRVRKEQPKQRLRFGLMVFDRRDCARDRAHIAGAHLLRPFLSGESHTFPVEPSAKAGASPYYFLPRIYRAITNFWISLVPSPMVQSFTSR